MSNRQRFHKGDPVFHVGSKLRGVIVRGVPLFGDDPEHKKFVVELADLGVLEIPESQLLHTREQAEQEQARTERLREKQR